MGGKKKRHTSGHVELELDVDAINEMTLILASYVVGPGFDGFLAFLDRRVAEMSVACPGCGQPHMLPAVNVPVVRGNLERFIRVLEEAE